MGVLFPKKRSMCINLENMRHQMTLHDVLSFSKILNEAFTRVGFNVRYPVAQCSLFKFFLKLLDQQCWRFSEGYLNNFSTELSTQIFDCCPRNFLIQEKQNGNVVSTSHWIRPVIYMNVAFFKIEHACDHYCTILLPNYPCLMEKRHAETSGIVRVMTMFSYQWCVHLTSHDTPMIYVGYYYEDIIVPRDD